MFRSAIVYLFLVLLFSSFSWLIYENMSSEKLLSVDFEVFGKVQGVFFRKNTEKEANNLGVRGWCMNTQKNTVKGVIQGSPEKINEMKTWLQEVGSPSSRIDKTVFTNEKYLSKYTFSSFQIKR
ncbi:unnamed protein product [Psylliodes chrysocephalus]|uniref:acylphosphatase n=2 Tax=Psylliodes chrysocephalus TaxID=3402493 RepID=A0A9P0D1R3_9CUCU|nr:unnamed protein product [Psylliodes chrysocephala]